MKAVIQRTTQASVSVDGKIVGQLTQNAPGLLILLGVHKEDSRSDVEYLAKKIIEFRIFNDEQGKMNKSTKEVNAEILVVSQFTLYATWRQGRRPGLSLAGKPEESRVLYEYFVDSLKEYGIKVATGIFGADMQISLINDGPVTFVLDTREN